MNVADLRVAILTWHGSERDYRSLAKKVIRATQIAEEQLDTFVSQNPFSPESVKFLAVLRSELVTLAQSVKASRDLLSNVNKLRNFRGAISRFSRQIVGFVTSRRVRSSIKREYARLHNMNIAFLEVAKLAGLSKFWLFLEDDAVTSIRESDQVILAELSKFETTIIGAEYARVLINLSRSFTLAELGARNPLNVGTLGSATILKSTTPKLNTTCAFMIDSESLREFSEFLIERIESRWVKFQAIDTTLAQFLFERSIPTLFAVPEPFLQGSMHGTLADSDHASG